MIINKAGFNKVIIGAGTAAALLVYYLNDARTAAFPQCPFYLLTHIYCPGCGSQRAISALLRGQVAAAAHNNLLLVGFLPLLSYSALLSLKQTKHPYARLFYKPAFVWFVLIIVLLFWVLRNVAVYPFTLMAPLG
jgi:hypothetical protein